MSNPITRLNAALEGRYRIESELGEGGMATVYLADDLKHERKVALKVLKPELAVVVGAERFLAEIKTTANLQHPHILPLFDSGEADTFLFYVMPYVEGESLRDRLDREHQLPVDDAVRIASDVAEALEYAHGHGVIHRDIKPANILIQAGRPLIADFGIALAVSAGGGHRLTETGLSLGTPHYMSPEQSTGDEAVGPATDTYALGCVLYEMLAGEPPFTGSTPQAILGKIIAGEPESVTAQRKSVPPNVDAVIAKALEKVPADRFTGTQDFAKALAAQGFRHGEAAAVTPVLEGGWKRLSLALGAVSAALAVALVIPVDEDAATREGQPARLALGLPVGQSLVQDTDHGVEIAPDGRALAYVAQTERGMLLHYRPPDQLDGIPLAGTSAAEDPFFSPDGEWLGFFANNALKKVPVTGGAVEIIAVLGSSNMNGATWVEGDTIYFARSGPVGLLKVAASGGAPEVVTEPGAGDVYHGFPHAMPGGRDLLFQVGRRPDPSGLTPGSPSLEVLSLEDGSRHLLLQPGTRPQYARSGHLIYYWEGALWAAALDADRVRVVGEPSRVADGVFGHPSIARNGTLLYVESSAPSPISTVAVSRGGAERAIAGIVCACGWPAYSADGQKLALREDGPEGGLWIHDLGGEGALTLPSSAGASFFSPAWMPSGDSISFVMDRSLMGAPVDGSSLPRFLAQRAPEIPETAAQYAASYSPDGNWLVYPEQRPAERQNVLVVLDRTGSGTAPSRLTEGSIDYAPRISPDGHWLAYQSRRTGQDEVWVRPFPQGGAPQRVTNGGGMAPMWAPDMSELFYRVGSSVWAVEIETDPGFRTGARQELFDGPYATSNLGANYDVHPSGDEFVMTRLGDWRARMILAQNFFEELKRLVPD